MSLDKNKLKAELESAYIESWNAFIKVLDDNSKADNPSPKPQPAAFKAAAKVLSEKFSTSIDNYIKSAEIVTPPGIYVYSSSMVGGTGATGATMQAGVGSTAGPSYQSIEDSPKAKIS